MAQSMLGEMVPPGVGTAAMGIAAFANWTGNLLVGQFFPRLICAGTGTVLSMFAGACVLACGFAIRWIPETRARTLEQIEGELVWPVASRDHARAPCPLPISLNI